MISNEERLSSLKAASASLMTAYISAMENELPVRAKIFQMIEDIDEIVKMHSTMGDSVEERYIKAMEDRFPTVRLCQSEDLKRFWFLDMVEGSVLWFAQFSSKYHAWKTFEQVNSAGLPSVRN